MGNITVVAAANDEAEKECRKTSNIHSLIVMRAADFKR